MRYFIIIFSSIFLLNSCSVKHVKLDHEGCGSRTLTWTYGPKKDVPYVDVCYSELNIENLEQSFKLIPITGIKQETGEIIDNNNDGISGNGKRISTDIIHWGGNSCQKSVRRISQKGCQSNGNNSRTVGCEWVAIRFTNKPNIQEDFVSLTPIWHIRMPDGKEMDIEGKTLTTRFSNCR
jgi:hypothetical protein